MRGVNFANVIILIFISSLICSCGAENQPVATWSKVYGGSGEDIGLSSAKAEDGGYIVVGSTTSADGDVKGNHGGMDAWVFKLGEDGTMKWQKCFGGSGSDGAKSIVQANGSGYLIVGSTDSQDGDVKGRHGVDAEDLRSRTDVWVIKIDTAGTMEWQVCVGGSMGEWGNDVSRCKNGGYILVGHAWSDDGDVQGRHGDDYGDAWVVKLSDQGSVEWQRCIGGTGIDLLNYVAELDDGGFLLTGRTNSNDGDVVDRKGWRESAWVVKLSKAGSLLWQSYVDQDSYEAQCGIEDASGNIICTTSASKADRRRLTQVHRFSPDGAVLETKQVGNGGGDDAFDLAPIEDGGFVLAGSSWSSGGEGMKNNGKSDVWLVELDKNLLVNWQRCYGGSEEEEAKSIQAIKGGGFVVFGSTESIDGDLLGKRGGDRDVWVLKLDNVVILQPH